MISGCCSSISSRNRYHAGEFHRFTSIMVSPSRSLHRSIFFLDNGCFRGTATQQGTSSSGRILYRSPQLRLFQGTNHALYSTFVATSALAVRAISTYALQEISTIGYHMIWWNTLFRWGLGRILTWVHFFRGNWKRDAGNHKSGQVGGRSRWTG